MVQAALAVICALDWELAHLRQALAADGDGLPVELVVSEMGMHKAALAAQRVIGSGAPRCVLNYGCAGAHTPELLPGDLVVGTRAVAYVDGYAADASAELVEVAQRVAEAHVDRQEPWPVELGWPEGISHRAPRVAFGTVASADVWNRDSASIQSLNAQFGSLCEDMEAAAIGRVCAEHGVPFLTIKDISNNELLRPTLSGTAMLAELGVDQIARRAALFTLEILRALS